jgi:hypothetical protein
MKGSKHYSGQAVDFGFNSNPSLAGKLKKFFCCASMCGFSHGQTEGGRGPHVHLQLVSGNGVPALKKETCCSKNE